MGNQPRRRIPHDEGIDYRENKYAAPVGAIWLLLAVIGLIAVGFFCVQFTRGLLDNTAEKQKFEQFLGPFVMFDPVPFDDPVNADPDFLLQSSVWCTILGEKRESYQFDELGRLMVPASDVDVTCARVYGENVKLEHRSFGDFERPNVYDEDTKTYYVWVNIQADLYSPSVERVVKKGDQYTLTVGYLPADTVWTRAQAEASGNKAIPDKSLYYDLLKVKDHYQLLSIRYIPLSETQSGAAQIPGSVSSSSSADAAAASSAQEADMSSSSVREDEDTSSSEDEDTSSAEDEDTSSDTERSSATEQSGTDDTSSEEDAAASSSSSESTST